VIKFANEKLANIFKIASNSTIIGFTISANLSNLDFKKEDVSGKYHQKFLKI